MLFSLAYRLRSSREIEEDAPVFDEGKSAVGPPGAPPGVSRFHRGRVDRTHVLERRLPRDAYLGVSNGF